MGKYTLGSLCAIDRGGRGVANSCACRLVSKKVSGKGEWGHWGAAPVGTLVGIGLLLGSDE